MKKAGDNKFALIGVFLCFVFGVFLLFSPAGAGAQSAAAQAVMVISIDGPINPATDDYLKTSIAFAKEQDAQLLVVKLNTPGGLLNSMQTMVESLLEAPLPTAIYVSPSGGGAISAGVFITLAGHFAVMAPATTIGAAHPVLGSGGDVKGDMREKIENFTVSLIRAIAERRGRNTEWAEKAVRESVAISDREAVSENVVDFIAADVDKLLDNLEGKTVTVGDDVITLRNLRGARRVERPMSFKQLVVNILSDPNIAILLGLGAMLGLGIELYHPGAIFPGVFGAVCLVLSLTAGQILPISYGGAALLLLGFLFFGVELVVPSFGIWGAAGIVCLVLGSIYFVDTDLVWSAEGFTVNKGMIGSIAGSVGLCLLGVVYLAISARNQRVQTGREGLKGKIALVKSDFVSDGGVCMGQVQVMGELWRARVSPGSLAPVSGDRLVVKSLEDRLELLVESVAKE